MSEPATLVEQADFKAPEKNPFTGLGGPLCDEPAEKPEGQPNAMWLGNRWWIPNEEWRTLEGVLADSKLDTSEEKAKERAWELEHDARKFGHIS